MKQTKMELYGKTRKIDGERWWNIPPFLGIKIEESLE
jgi:hypothetical protein